MQANSKYKGRLCPIYRRESGECGFERISVQWSVNPLPLFCYPKSFSTLPLDWMHNMISVTLCYIVYPLRSTKKTSHEVFPWWVMEKADMAKCKLSTWVRALSICYRFDIFRSQKSRWSRGERRKLKLFPVR